MRAANPDRDAQIDELLDKQALYELVVRYCRAVDRADVELMRSCYHPDAIDEHGYFSGGVEELIAAMQDGGVLDPSSRPAPVQHSVTNALFEIDGDIAHGETYNVVRRIAEDGTFYVEGYGRYVDRFERRAGQWRIAHRRVVVDWVAPEHDGHEFIRGTRDRGDPSYDRSVRISRA
jgi:hypothetical protein